MAIREIKPLDKDQWKLVIDTIKAKPTTSQKNMMKNAIREGSAIKISSE